MSHLSIDNLLTEILSHSEYRKLKTWSEKIMPNYTNDGPRTMILSWSLERYVGFSFDSHNTSIVLSQRKFLNAFDFDMPVALVGNCYSFYEFNGSSSLHKLAPLAFGSFVISKVLEFL